MFDGFKMLISTKSIKVYYAYPIVQCKASRNYGDIIVTVCVWCLSF